MSATKVVLLGTGSPRPCLDRSQPAQLIEIAGQAFVIDCGDGVTGQLVRAGCDVAAVQKIFLTHLHWDHILGYAGLVWGGWSAGRPTLEVWGPPGTKKMHELLFTRLYKDDVDWSSGIGYVRSGIDSIKVHEIGEGLVYERDGMTGHCDCGQAHDYHIRLPVRVCRDTDRVLRRHGCLRRAGAMR